MEMTSITPSFPLFFLLLFFSLSWATFPHQQYQIFLQCLQLPKQGLHSNTTYYATSDPSYSSILQAYIQNTRFLSSTIPKPLAIVVAKNESDIQTTIYCTKESGLELRIRSGGHDFEGLSFISQVPFVILDLFDMREIIIDKESHTAWVQAGATIGELYYGISAVSRALGFPAGYCSTVGSGGHISGGGYGPLLRKYGFASDNVVDARFIDVKGRILERETMGEDLFWAIRGGGGGNFGVLVAWKVKLVPVPEKVTVFQKTFTIEKNATELVHKWQHIAHKLDNDLCLAVVMSSMNFGKRKRTVLVRFDALFLGGTHRLLLLMQKMFPELGLAHQDCKEMSWIESVLYFGGFDRQPTTILLNREAKPRTSYKGKSDYVKIPISVDGLKGMWDVFLKTESAEMAWHPYGGKMAEIGEGETPYPHGAGNLFMMLNTVSWDAEKLGPQSPRHLGWIREMYSYLEPYVSKFPRSAYVNYRDLDLGVNKIGNLRENYKAAKTSWGTQYFKNNFDRLVQVKTRIDPDNFFRSEQSIPPHPTLSKI